MRQGQVRQVAGVGFDGSGRRVQAIGVSFGARDDVLNVGVTGAAGLWGDGDTTIELRSGRRSGEHCCHEY